MPRFRVFVSLSVAVLFAFFLAGCSREIKPDGLPDLHPCEINLTMKGVPLEGAAVSLYGSDGRWNPSGQTNAQGRAIIITRQFSGAAAGDYKVVVSKYEKVVRSPSSDSSPELPPPPSLVAEQYSRPDTTPLSCTVKPGKNSFDFTVEAP